MTHKYGTLPTYSERMAKATKADYERVKKYRSKNIFYISAYMKKYRKLHPEYCQRQIKKYLQFYHPVCGENCLMCKHSDCEVKP